ncbi:hypothetical protein CA13_56260 [Planctomycetes bacterium CA13]|uniref:Uncharacterized protein n=1 Tax=Novipirellula herctigrandis TaxID=2527986 RepID=A0A5C5ZAB2_9BACT|nr:hypothetical protein CA13_56260 [Planctomycetes bacterium CA13]
MDVPYGESIGAKVCVFSNSAPLATWECARMNAVGKSSPDHFSFLGEG